MRRPLILDLDYTLLHLEAVPGSIEVPGRTRSAFLAPATSAALRAIQDRFDLVLATARSWDGTAPVAEGLEARGVRVSGVVLEDGARLGDPHDLTAFEHWRDWNAVQARVDNLLRDEAAPSSEWQRDFVSCLVARCENGTRAGELMDWFAERLDEFDADLRTFRDGRKVYLTGRHVTKWTALQRLLGARVNEAAGVGDGPNDCCWLGGIPNPATFAGADSSVQECVRAAGGFFSPLGGHAGIADVLRHLAQTL